MPLTREKTTPRKFNIALKNRQSQKETSLPIINLQGRAVEFQGCTVHYHKESDNLMKLFSSNAGIVESWVLKILFQYWEIHAS